MKKSMYLLIIIVILISIYFLSDNKITSHDIKALTYKELSQKVQNRETFYLITELEEDPNKMRILYLQLLN